MVSDDLVRACKDELLDLDRFPAEEASAGPRRRSRRLAADRSGAARAADDRLSVDQGRLGLLAGLRPHLRAPVPGSSLRRAGAKYQRVAPRHLRRSHLSLRLLQSSRACPGAFPVPPPATTLHRPYHVPREQQMPQQESGTRQSRALPYLLMVDGHGDGDRFWIEFINGGRVGAAFSVHDGSAAEVRAAPLRSLRRRSTCDAGEPQAKSAATI